MVIINKLTKDPNLPTAGYYVRAYHNFCVLGITNLCLATNYRVLSFAFIQAKEISFIVNGEDIHIILDIGVNMDLVFNIYVRRGIIDEGRDIMLDVFVVVQVSYVSLI